MKKLSIIVLIVLFMGCVVVSSRAYGREEGTAENMMGQTVLQQAFEEARMEQGVRQLSYDRFVKIRNSGEKYVLLDVLPPDSYTKGHIEGAFSFPVDTINKDSAARILSKDSKIIVYCGSFQCTASTAAAKKLSALGYDVLDYKGGLKEWQEKGNRLVK